MPTCSLLLSTYNWPEALQLCLASIAKQSLLPDEIIVADDGSTVETKEMVSNFALACPIPVRHIWQPDEGFQLSAIRNKAIAASTFDYIIQIDGDLILHPDFVKDHMTFSKEGCFTTGSRMLLSPKTSQSLFENKSTNVKKYLSNDRNYLNGKRIPFLQNFLSTRYKNKGKYQYYVKGCNMAFWKKDLIRVNGYNENFTGWGREDSEIAIRLINVGIKKRFLKFGAVSYHLYHPEASREMEEKNIIMMKEAISNKVTRATIGLDRYLK